MKRVAYVPLFFSLGILFPVLILVGLFIAIRAHAEEATREITAVGEKEAGRVVAGAR